MFGGGGGGGGGGGERERVNTRGIAQYFTKRLPFCTTFNCVTPGYRIVDLGRPHRVEDRYTKERKTARFDFS